MYTPHPQLGPERGYLQLDIDKILMTVETSDGNRVRWNGYLRLTDLRSNLIYIKIIYVVSYVMHKVMPC